MIIKMGYVAKIRTTIHYIIDKEVVIQKYLGLKWLTCKTKTFVVKDCLVLV